jgi:hypothetical protein
MDARLTHRMPASERVFTKSEDAVDGSRCTFKVCIVRGALSFKVQTLNAREITTVAGNFAGTWRAGFSEQGTPPEYRDANVRGLALPEADSK